MPSTHIAKSILSANSRRALGLALVLTLCGSSSQGQVFPTRSKTSPLAITSGVQTFRPGPGVLGEDPKPSLEFETSIEAPEPAAWVRLQFGQTDLGDESYLTITSTEDGSVQRLDSRSLGQWRRTSAVFNGGSVVLRLYAAPGDGGVVVEVKGIEMGQSGSDGAEAQDQIPESLCGGDNRIPESDPRIARIRPVGCTGWLIATGEFLTAGHCTDGSGGQMAFVEFNVPPSLSNGTVVNAAPQDQYAIDPSSIRYFDDGFAANGNDWAVFRTFDNSDTGVAAARAQGDFYRLTQDIADGATIRITGFGVDKNPLGTAGGRNSSSQTQQTDHGPFLDRAQPTPNDDTLEYAVDTAGGNSGGPVILDGTSVAAGIHTNAGCNPPADGNVGTGFGNVDLLAAIDQWPSEGALFVDPGHPLSSGTGSILHPFASLEEALEQVEDGGTIVVAPGSFPDGVAIEQSVTVSVPFGPVAIGTVP